MARTENGDAGSDAVCMKLAQEYDVSAPFEQNNVPYRHLAD